MPAENVGTVIGLLMSQDFKKVNTLYDSLKNNKDFRRYEKVVDLFRITIDFFVSTKNEIEPVEVNGWKVVSPKQLLSFYSNIHSSDNCFAVKAASTLIEKGIDPIGQEEMVTIPKE